MTRRRHGLLLLMLFSLPLGGSTCLDDNSAIEERKKCERVCASEAQCPGLRSEEDCLRELCAPDGFKVIETADETHDLATLRVNDCELNAEDCSELVRCTCRESCERIDECTGGENAVDCEDNCEVLVEQAPESVYLENRCKLESTCADLPACG